MQWIVQYAPAVGLVVGIVTAFLWTRAATIAVPDATDLFIPAFNEVGRWNRSAAIASAVTALLQAVSLFSHL
jgi:hypothetical protein